MAQLVNVIGPIRAEPGRPAWRQTTFHPFAAVARSAGHTVHATTGPDDVVTCVVTVSPRGDEALVHLANRSPETTADVTIDLAGLGAVDVVGADLLWTPDPYTTNTVDAPDAVCPRPVPAALAARHPDAAPARRIVGQRPRSLRDRGHDRMASKTGTVTMADVGAARRRHGPHRLQCPLGTSVRASRDAGPGPSGGRRAGLPAQHVRAQPAHGPHRIDHARHPRARHRLLHGPRRTHHDRGRAPRLVGRHPADRGAARQRAGDPQRRQPAALRRTDLPAARPRPRRRAAPDGQRPARDPRRPDLPGARRPRRDGQHRSRPAGHRIPRGPRLPTHRRDRLEPSRRHHQRCVAAPRRVPRGTRRRTAGTSRTSTSSPPRTGTCATEPPGWTDC